MEQYLSIDIGGTFIKYSIMNENYEVLEEKEEATKKEPEDFLNQLKEITISHCDRVKGIAACIAGFINPVTGDNSDFSVGERFRKYNLKKELEQASNVPVILENDSNCAAIGEMVCGAANSCSDFCLLTIGTGIGGAIVIDKQLVRGKHFKAGEAGLMIIGLNENGEQICGESAGATSVLTRKVSQAIGKQIDGFYVFQHLEEDKIRKIYQKWLLKTAVTVGNMAMLLDPEVMLIGGGISQEARFIKDLEKAVYDLYPHLKQYTIIRACEMGNQAGRIGALYLWLQQHRKGNKL